MDEATRVLMKEIAREAATEAVRETLTAVGIDPNNPLEGQRNSVALVQMRRSWESDDFQADLAFTRRLRVATETAKGHSIRVVVGAVVLAVLGMLILGFKEKLGLPT